MYYNIYTIYIMIVYYLIYYIYIYIYDSTNLNLSMVSITFNSVGNYIHYYISTNSLIDFDIEIYTRAHINAVNEQYVCGYYYETL